MIHTQKIKEKGIQIAVLAAMLMFWEFAVRLNPGTLVPRPIDCFTALFELASEGILFTDLFASLGRVSVGFAIAVFFGLSIGFLLGLTPFLKKSVIGIFELFRPIPPIAWIPMAVALLGIGDASAWFVIFIGAFFPILTNTLLGVSNIDKLHMEAAKVLGASKVNTFKNVVWPSTLPSIFAGLRVGLGFAWMCVVAAEMFASRSGLGYEIQLNRQIFRLDRVVAGMITIAAVGFLMSRLMTFLEWIFVPWRRGHIAKDFFESITNTQTQFLPQPNRSGLNGIAGNGLANGSNGNGSALADWKPAAGAALTVENLRFAYPGVPPVLEGINLTVKSGEIFCVLGMSGCGKTTLLRLMAGLETDFSGSISIEGQDLRGHREDVTMVFQNFSLFPWKTVGKNARFGIEQREVDKTKWDEEAEQMLRLVGLAHKSAEYPHLLSGGQMQRVAFARALACRPRLMLLDEPFSALDSHTRETLQEEMARLFKRSGVTVVMVTHDIAEAIFMADRIAIMAPDGGHLMDEYTVSAPRPRDRKFRNSQEFRDLADNLWQQMHPKEMTKETAQ